MKPIVAPSNFKNSMIDDTAIGFTPGQVFAFISSAMRSSGERGCNCSIGWFVLALPENIRSEEKNREGMKRAKGCLVEMAITLLEERAGKDRNR
jgi:hypothetical protein